MKTFIYFMILLQFVFFTSCEKKHSEPISTPYNYLDELDFIIDGLIGYYPFNGDTKDYSGLGNHAIATNMTYAVDRYNNPSGAIHFNGIDDFVVIPEIGTLLDGNEGTIIIWCKPDSLYIEFHQPKPVVFALVDSINTCFLLSNCVGSLEYSFGNYPKLGGGSVNQSININGYILFVLSFSDNGITRYDSNGHFAVSSVSNPQYSFGFNGDRKEQDLYLGKSIIDTFVSGIWDNFFTYFKGEIDDLLIYNRILEEDEIKTFFNLAKQKIAY